MMAATNPTMQTPKANNSAIGTTMVANSHGHAVGTQVPPKYQLPELIAKRTGLESESGSLYGWLIAASVVVAVGVALEFVEDLFEVVDAWKARCWPSWRKLIVFTGTLVVIAGVTGEFIAEALVGDNDSALRKNNERIEGVLSDKLLATAGVASTAKYNAQTALTNAGAAKLEADDAKNALDPINRRERELQAAESSLSKRADELKTEIASSEARLAEVKKEVIDFEDAVEPRQVEGGVATAIPFSVPVYIYYENRGEPKELAESIARAFNEKWSVKIFSRDAGESELDDGVTIAFGRASLSDANLFFAASSICNALEDQHIDATVDPVPAKYFPFSHPSLRGKLEPNALIIDVGKKPSRFFENKRMAASGFPPTLTRDEELEQWRHEAAKHGYGSNWPRHLGCG